MEKSISDHFELIMTYLLGNKIIIFDFRNKYDEFKNSLTDENMISIIRKENNIMINNKTTMTMDKFKSLLPLLKAKNITRNSYELLISV